MLHKSIPLFLLVLGLLLGASNVLAQTAILTGVVKDPSGSVMPAVRVTATHTQRNLSYEATTDETGLYLLQSLPIGSYRIKAEFRGFKTFEQGGLELTVDLKALLNIVMEIGDIAEKVEVRGQASRVDVLSPTLQQLVDSRRVLELPLNGRDVYQLAKLVPGTGDSGFNINGGRSGQRNTTANVRLDGGMNVEQNLMTVLPSPSPDAVQEFNIQTSMASAKYAYSAGVIEVATKSGTNELHGTLYDFFRNDALDARNFFLPTKTTRRRNQYGAALGGPVWLPRLYNGRNRTFWFFNFEQQKEPLGTPATIFTPTAAQLQGDFSGFGRTILDPVTNQPFAGNRIPANRLDPLALNIIKKFVPEAQAATGRYTYQRRVDNNPTQVLARVDHNVGLNQFTHRSYITRSTRPSNFGDLPFFSDGASYTNTGIHTFSYTRLISPRTINVLRVSYNLWDQGSNSGKDIFSLEELRAMGWSNNYYNYTKNFPGLNVSGFFNVAGTLPVINRGSDTFTWEDELSLHRGRHSLEVGFRAMRALQADDPIIVRSMGSYTFNGQFSGSALTDFLLGRPSFFEQQGEQSAHIGATTLGWYAQDNIKVTPRLSVNLGLRYELPLAPVALDGFLTVFRPGSTQKSTQFVNAPPGLLFKGDPGVGQSGRNTPKKQFGPRIGVVYALTADQRTTLRAGYGIYYNPTWTNVEGQPDNKQPWVNRIGVTPPASTADPWANFPGGNPFPTPKRDKNFVFRSATEFGYAPGFVEPQLQQWNLNLQREIAKDYLVTVGYVGTTGTHLLMRTDLNAARYIPGQSTLANLDSRRPFYPPLTTIEWIESSANSSYHSLQVSLDKRFGRGFSVMSSYTFSKTLDWQSDTVGGFVSFPQDPANYRAERSPSYWDRTHASVTSWVWHLPTPQPWKGLLRQVAGDWEVNGILTLYSGTPLGMTATRDRALRGLPNRPDRLRDARLSGDRSRAEMIVKYFDTTAYVPNQDGQFGSAPRLEAQLRAPGSINFDFGVVKRFNITERHRLEFRGEFFNLPNRPNFLSPGTNIDSPGSFGRIVSAADGRIIQLGLKFLF